MQETLTDYEVVLEHGESVFPVSVRAESPEAAAELAVSSHTAEHKYLLVKGPSSLLNAEHIVLVNDSIRIPSRCDNCSRFIRGGYHSYLCGYVTICDTCVSRARPGAQFA